MLGSFERDWDHLSYSLELVINEISESSHHLPNNEMCNLLIAGEDHRFHSHSGVDPLGLMRACWRTLVCGRREGGSTIAMQLVRTITGKKQLSLSRKCIEIVLAKLITRRLPKDLIPSIYLWVAYYGADMNNFEQACRKLEINPRNASLTEAAELVARLKYPSPKTHNSTRLAAIEQRSRYLIKRYHKLNNK